MMTVRGKVKGRILYRVDTGHGCTVATLDEWIVTSIQHPPRRSLLARIARQRKVRVYVTSAGRRSHFDLDAWPGPYSVTERAAWKASIARIVQEIEDVEGWLVEAAEDNEEAWIVELRAERTLLRRSLTKARREATKCREATP